MTYCIIKPTDFFSLLLQKIALYLDTTYCNEEYSFPSQQDAISDMLKVMHSERKYPGTLFLMGSYTIGKERVFVEAAREFKTKIFVKPEK